MRLKDLIKRINLGEIHFLPKLKLLPIILDYYDYQSLQDKLDVSQILGDFRYFLIQPVAHSIF